MKRRWFWYSLLGIAFGIFDFYWQAFISNTLHLQQAQGTGGMVVWLIASVGIWLAPVIPVIFHEANVSHSAWLSALASTIVWCAAVAAYYLTNGFQLAFIGVPERPELLFSNQNDPYFWANWKSVFFYDLVGGSIEWLVAAVIGGSLIGLTVSFLYIRLKGIRQAEKSSPAP
jgi:hypothetical protein